MSRHLLLTTFAFTVAACGGKDGPATSSSTTKPTTPGGDPAETAAPVEVERVVVSQGRQSGTQVTTRHPDGTIHVLLDVLENGRGPRADATLTLAADGTIATLDSEGYQWMRTPEVETFRRDGDRASWKSVEDGGEAKVDGPAFYIPISVIPEATGLMVTAAIQHGGAIPLLPTGEARVVAGPKATVDGPDGPRTVVNYTVTGLDIGPFRTWMNEDGTWWGHTYEWWSVVPEGYEASIPQLLAVQNQQDDVDSAQLVKDHAHVPPAAGLAYTNARVLDVEKGKWLPGRTVVVVGDTITAVGKTGKVKIPAGAEVIDLAGKALLPGMIDMHAHLGDLDGPLNIASGVTSVRDVGNDPDSLDAYKAQYDAGTAIGPRVFRFGFIEGRGEKAASSKITATTEEEALAAVKFYVDRGYDGVKIYNSVPTELVPVIAEAAHAAKKKVIGHIPVHMLANEAVKAGYDGIEHINMLFLNFLATHETDTRDTTRFTLVGEKAADLDLESKEVKAFVELLRDRKTLIDPTLGAFEGLLAGQPGEIIPGLEPMVARMPPVAQRGWLLNGVAGQDVEQYRKAFQACLDLVRVLHQAKVPLVIGTDSLAGLMYHHELALFVRAGVPAAATLKMATIGAAQWLGQGKRLGSIAKGKAADLVVIDGDPLKQIDDIGKVVSTMKAGVVYPSAPLYRAFGIQPLVE